MPSSLIPPTLCSIQPPTGKPNKTRPLSIALVRRQPTVMENRAVEPFYSVLKNDAAVLKNKSNALKIIYFRPLKT
jgi:hypothetical protein